MTDYEIENLTNTLSQLSTLQLPPLPIKQQYVPNVETFKRLLIEHQYTLPTESSSSLAKYKIAKSIDEWEQFDKQYQLDTKHWSIVSQVKSDYQMWSHEIFQNSDDFSVDWAYYCLLNKSVQVSDCGQGGCTHERGLVKYKNQFYEFQFIILGDIFSWVFEFDCTGVEINYWKFVQGEYGGQFDLNKALVLD